MADASRSYLSHGIYVSITANLLCCQSITTCHQGEREPRSTLMGCRGYTQIQALGRKGRREYNKTLCKDQDDEFAKRSAGEHASGQVVMVCSFFQNPGTGQCRYTYWQDTLRGRALQTFPPGPDRDDPEDQAGTGQFEDQGLCPVCPAAERCRSGWII